ncbi:sigma factor [Kribbella solani]|nr:sigma factor [Kribbella solani]MDX3005010.1 sigma factor [Kribbella solani]
MSDGLIEAFEAERGKLKAVAYRLLGSHAEAEDAVQEAWIRLHRTDGVDNLGGWLRTVVTRICLDELRARKIRPE